MSVHPNHFLHNLYWYALLLGLIAAPIYAPISEAALASQWRFDELSWNGSAGEVADSTGANQGVAQGAQTATSGKVCNRGAYDGVDDYIDFGDVLDPGSSHWSVAMWFRWDGSGGENILYNKENLYEARVLNGYFHYAWRPHWNWDGGTSIPVVANTWTHVVVTYDRSTQRVYKNGVLVYSRNQGGNIGSNNNKFLVGARGNTTPFNYFGGDIDEVYVYSHALSAAEVSTLHSNTNAGNNYDGSARTCPTPPPPAPPARAEWRFDEQGWSATAAEVADSIASFDGVANSGTTTTAAGKVCRAGDFSANSTLDYVSLDSTALDGQANFTLALWAKTNNTGNQALLSGARSGQANEVLMWLSSPTTFQFFFKGVSRSFAIPNIADGLWHHYSVTKTGNQACFFLDGVARGCQTGYATAAPSINVGGLIIGQEQDSVGGSFDINQDWQGEIDEVRIYDVVLSQVDINTVKDETHACPASLASQWRFDELQWNGTSGEVADSTGAYHGIAVGAQTTSPGKVCNRGTFDGVGDHIDFGDVLDPGASNWSVAVWFRWDGSSDENILYNKENLYEARVLDGYFHYAWRPHWSWDGGTSIPVVANTWTHVVVTYDGSTQSVYKDGNLVYSRAQSGNIGTTSNKLLIGARGSGSPRSFFGGDIDEVYMYADALSAAEVTTIYTNTDAGKNHDGNSRTCPTPLPTAQAEWRFDEDLWNTTPNEVQDSANAYHGVGFGSTTTTADGKVCRAGDFSANGTADYVTLDAAALHGQSSFTLTMWAKTTNFSNQALLSGANSGQNNEVLMWLASPTTFAFFYKGTSRNFAVPNLADGGWHHFALTKTGTQACLYIDGVARGCQSGYSSSAPIIDTGGLVIAQEQDSVGGSFDPNQDWHGEIDEVRIYSSVLTSTHINVVMNQTHTCPGALIAQWRFDEATWDGSAGEVKDSTASFTGVANGALANTSGKICNRGVFDGLNDYVDFGDVLDPGANMMTIAIWFRWDGSGGDNILYNKETLYEARVRNGYFQYAWQPHWNWDGGTSFPVAANTWTHAVVTYDGSSQKVYRNGVLVYSRAQSGNIGANNNKLLIGARGSGAPSSYFGGDIDEVYVYSSALGAGEVATLYNNTNTAKNHNGTSRSCSQVVDHFEIVHDGYGINCTTETVVITAKDSSNATITDYAGVIDIATSTAHGSWTDPGNSAYGTLTDPGADDGAASYSFLDDNDGINDDDGTITLYLSNIHQESFSISVVDSSNVASATSSAVIAFNASGFTVTANAINNPPPALINDPVQNVTAGSSFNLHIAAFGTTDNDPICGVIEEYDGPKPLYFWTNYINPNTGTVVARVDNGDIGASEASAVLRNVTFSAGQAIVNARYKDVGNISIAMKDVSVTEPVTGIRGATNPFVAKPSTFTLTDIKRTSDSFSNPAASNAGGLGFIAAGDNFSITVSAIDAQGSVTPNYGRESPAESIVLTKALIEPVGGNDPAFQIGSGFGAFSNGSATGTTFSWNEVGIISLLPSVGDSDYMGAGNVTGTSSGFIGRFYPSYFTTLVVDGSFANKCSAATDFTYLGDTFGYQTNPIIEVTAQNLAGNVTQNYRDGFRKLVTGGFVFSYPSADNQLGADGITPLALNISTNAPSLSDNLVIDGQVDYRFGNDDYNYIKDVNSEVPSFTSDIRIGLSNITDSDGASASDLPKVISPNGNLIYFGRMVVENAHGPELEDLAVPMFAQYLSTAGFIINTDDGCTNGLPPIALSSPTGNIQTSDTTPSFTQPPGLGDFALTLTAPGDGNDGSLTVSSTVPSYLQYDWSNVGVHGEDPQAVVIFGIHKGNENHIYIREVLPSLQ